MAHAGLRVSRGPLPQRLIAIHLTAIAPLENTSQLPAGIHET